MNRFKRWVVVTWATVASALGIQYKRPPVIEHRDPIVQASPTPASSTPTPMPPARPIDGVPSMALDKLKGAYGTEIDMVKRSFAEANDIMKTPCFMNKILGADFTEDNGLTNQQIYNLLASGVKKVNAEMYDGSWWENYVYKTMGYDIGDGTVYMNRFYADTTAIVRSLITHEGEGHGNGFHHYQAHSTSVPYQLNDFIEDCAPAAGLK